MSAPQVFDKGHRKFPTACSGQGFARAGNHERG
jgi:hypothetical protein